MNDKKLLYRSVFASFLNVAVHPVSESTMPRWIPIKLSNCFSEHEGVAHEAWIADSLATSNNRVTKLNEDDEQHWSINNLVYVNVCPKSRKAKDSLWVATRVCVVRLSVRIMQANLDIFLRECEILCRAQLGNVIVATVPVFEQEFEVQLAIGPD